MVGSGQVMGLAHELEEVRRAVRRSEADVASIGDRLGRLELHVARPVGQSVHPSLKPLRVTPHTSSQPDSARSPIALDSRVVVCGLQADTWYNGRYGTVVAGPFDGRVVVVLEPMALVSDDDDEEEQDDESLLVLPANVKVVQGPEPESGSEGDEGEGGEGGEGGGGGGEGGGERQGKHDEVEVRVEHASFRPPHHTHPQARHAHHHASGPITGPELDAALADAKSLDCANQDGWDQFLQMQEVQAFRKRVAGKSVYLYKSCSRLTGVQYRQFVDMYVHLKYRESWDETAIAIDVLGEHAENTVVYWAVKLPWPMACRDYVYYRRIKSFPDRSTTVVLCRGAKLGEHKGEVEGFVRVEDFVSNTVIVGEEDGSVTVYCTYMDDPKGSIPKFLVNFASKQAFPRMMDAFHKAYAGFPDYAKRERAEAPAPLPPTDPAPSPNEPQPDAVSRAAESALPEEAAVPVVPRMPKHPGIRPAAAVDTFLFEYPFSWDVVTRAVLEIKRTQQPGQRVEEPQPLTFRLFTAPPAFVSFIVGSSELEWHESIVVDDKRKQMHLQGQNATWRNRFHATECTVWYVSPDNPNHTLFRSEISLFVSWTPDATCRQILGHVKADMIKRRQAEVLQLQGGHPSSAENGARDEVAAPSDSAPRREEDREEMEQAEPPRDEHKEWLHARSLHDVAIATVQGADPLSRAPPVVEASWVAGERVCDVRVQWVRVRALRDGSTARERVTNGTTTRLVVGANEYGCELEVVLTPALKQGGCGPSARCARPAWVDQKLESQLHAALGRGEARFRVSLAPAMAKPGPAGAAPAPAPAQALVLVVDKAGVRVREARGEGVVFAGPFASRVEVEALADDAQGLSLSSPMYEDERFRFRLASPRDRDLAVLTVQRFVWKFGEL